MSCYKLYNYIYHYVDNSLEIVLNKQDIIHVIIPPIEIFYTTLFALHNIIIQLSLYYAKVMHFSSAIVLSTDL